MAILPDEPDLTLAIDRDHSDRAAMVDHIDLGQIPIWQAQVVLPHIENMAMIDDLTPHDCKVHENFLH
jgi:hypothetical protein